MEVFYSTVFIVVLFFFYRNEENCHSYYAGELLVIPTHVGTKLEQRPSAPEDPSLAQVPHSLKRD